MKKKEKLPASVSVDAAEAERRQKARRKKLLNSSGHFFDAEKVQEQEQEREQQQEQEAPHPTHPPTKNHYRFGMQLVNAGL